MLWRDDRGNVVAFNVAHLSGTEAWMGPLAVHPDHQGHGLGKAVVGRGHRVAEGSGAKVIGLETMPRTMDNIGFYSSLGMNPGIPHADGDCRWCVRRADERDGCTSVRLGSLTSDELDKAVKECRALTESLLPGYDFSREIQLTEELALGDTLMLYEGDTLVGFAVCHSVPLVEGRVREELRVLKLVVRNDDDFDVLVTFLSDHARRSGTRRVAFRMQGAVSRRLSTADAPRRARQVVGPADDARRILPIRPNGIVLSNWEI